MHKTTRQTTLEDFLWDKGTFLLGHTIQKEKSQVQTKINFIKVHTDTKFHKIIQKQTRDYHDILTKKNRCMHVQIVQNHRHES